MDSQFVDIVYFAGVIITMAVFSFMSGYDKSENFSLFSALVFGLAWPLIVCLFVLLGFSFLAGTPFVLIYAVGKKLKDIKNGN